MLRRGHPSALDRIVVQILQFLSHHRVIRNDLWMRAFLPDLVFGGFMRGAAVTKLIEQPRAAFDLELSEEFLCREAFQVAQNC